MQLGVEDNSILFHDCIVQLHKQLAETLQTRDQWREKDKETPQEEKARLLQQVCTFGHVVIQNSNFIVINSECLLSCS